MSVLPAACSLILPQTGQIAFLFDKSNFSKKNVPARLEGGGKRGAAEPVWARVVGAVCVPVTSVAVQDRKAATESIPKVSVAPLPWGTPAPGLLEETPLPWSGGCWGPVLRLHWGWRSDLQMMQVKDRYWK